MATIKIVGVAKPIPISKDMLEKIVRLKIDTDADQKHLIDIRGYGFVELGQIKQILPDDTSHNSENEMLDEKKRIRWEKEMDYEKLIATYRLQTPVEKAIRTVKSYALILWTARGNWTKPGDTIPEFIAKRIVERLIPYFEKNTNAWGCGREEYEDLIPLKRKDTPHSAVKGVASIGDAMSAEEMLSQVQF